jgi:hypothetical protein
MHARLRNWRLAGLTALEELVLCQWGEFEDNKVSPLPSDKTLSHLTKLTSLKLHVSVSQVLAEHIVTLLFTSLLSCSSLQLRERHTYV